MKKTIFVLIGIVALLASCKVETEKDLGPVTTRTITIEQFNQLDISINCDVEYVPSDSFSVTITAPAKQMDNIALTVSDSTLTINHNNSTTPGVIWIINNSGPAANKIVVKAPYLACINVAGSAELVCKEPLKANNMELNVRGSGSISTPSIVARVVTTSVAGSGTIEATNIMTQNFTTTVAGSGTIEAALTQANGINTTVAGSGTISLALKNCGNIKADISGSGTTTLSGNAKSLEQSLSGSGEINTDNLKLAQ